MKTNTRDLLQAYVEHGSEEAFSMLVSRYVDLVHSVALRRLSSDYHLAEDAVQTVFTDLARKAKELPNDVLLGGWLHRHTCFVAANLARREQRRIFREHEAMLMNTTDIDGLPKEDWKQLAPVLDESIDQLPAADRDALVLRYLEQANLRDVGTLLGVSEDAAQKRVSRALEKLRGMLVERGVSLPLSVVTLALVHQAVSAAPKGLGTTVATSVIQTIAPARMTLGTGPRSIATSRLKWGVLAVGVAVVLFWIQLAPNKRHAGQKVGDSTSESTANSASSSPRELAPAQPLPATEIETTNATPDTNEFLTLTLLAADSGRPLPNVPIDSVIQTGENTNRKPLQSTRDGVCRVPVSRTSLRFLELTTRVEGFADTRLVWRPDRGQPVPLAHTVKLDRAVRIGGRVLDPDGKPIEGAKVGFNQAQDPVAASVLENHLFGWIETTTDTNGRWVINRIGADALRRIYGRAKHPDHAPSEMMFLENSPAVASELRAETHTFQLRQRTLAAGRVVNRAGNPIKEATVVAGRAGDQTCEQLTADDGGFRLNCCEPGKLFLTATAPGYAPTTIEVDPIKATKPIHIVMGSGKLLQLRVMDARGRPITHAHAWLNPSITTIADSDSPSLPMVQIELRKSADHEGRIVWEQAPDQDLFFKVSAQGFMPIQQLRVRPGSPERELVLYPNLTVMGTVRDADLGSAVPAFRVISGWPELDPVSGTTNGIWSGSETAWAHFEQGVFRRVFDEQLTGAAAHPGYMLKFLADGYLPYISRPIRDDEEEVRLDVRLKRTAAMRLKVLRPDGKPGARVDVGLVIWPRPDPRPQLHLVAGGITKVSQENSDVLLQTDAHGELTLNADPQIKGLIIANEIGYAQSTVEQLTLDSTLRMKRWGRLETQFDLPGSRRGRLYAFVIGEYAFQSISLDRDSFLKVVDEQGRLVYPMVPPGKHKLFRQHAMKVGNDTAWRSGAAIDVEVLPGTTTRIQLNPQGHTVVARMILPSAVQRHPSMSINAIIDTRFPEPPGHIRNASGEIDQDALRLWQQSPEYLAAQARHQQFPLEESPNGLLTAEEVPSGVYRITISLIQQPTASGAPAEVIYQATRGLEIPSEPTTGTIDLGEIALQAVKVP